GPDAVAAGHAEKMAACRLARMAGARFEKRADCAQGPDQPRIGAAVDERSTRARMVEAEQHPHRRRLPCSVRAEESSDLAGPDGQGAVLEGAAVTVLLGGGFVGDHGVLPLRWASVPGLFRNRARS